jgi:hypothetical protein
MAPVKRTASIDAKRMLEDLNGDRQPHGLVLYFREALGISAGLNLKLWADEYVTKLRAYVDLWLATGRSNRVEIPATRHPTVPINHIVERVVTANRVLPAASKDGYLMTIQAVRPQPSPAWQAQAQPKPQSSVDREQYRSDEDYRRALIEEKFAEVFAANEKSALEVNTAMEDDLHADDLIATTAAERIFVEMLMSDWRLKIAKCVSPACSSYFRLKKWNQLYEKGTRCQACRDRDEHKDKQARVEESRKKASKQLWSFTANRFSRRISRSATWYRDAGLKSEIVEALNAHIESDKFLKSIYRHPITTKWLGWAKNRDEITRCVATEKRANAKS